MTRGDLWFFFLCLWYWVVSCRSTRSCLPFSDAARGSGLEMGHDASAGFFSTRVMLLVVHSNLASRPTTKTQGQTLPLALVHRIDLLFHTCHHCARQTNMQCWCSLHSCLAHMATFRTSVHRDWSRQSNTFCNRPSERKKTCALLALLACKCREKRHPNLNPFDESTAATAAAGPCRGHESNGDRRF
jgi:hypothetical protein